MRRYLILLYRTLTCQFFQGKTGQIWRFTRLGLCWWRFKRTNTLWKGIFYVSFCWLLQSCWRHSHTTIKEGFPSLLLFGTCSTFIAMTKHATEYVKWLSTYIFGDNQLIMVNTTTLHLQLKKKYLVLLIIATDKV